MRHSCQKIACSRASRHSVSPDILPLIAASFSDKPLKSVPMMITMIVIMMIMIIEIIMIMIMSMIMTMVTSSNWSKQVFEEK